jgi:hypothetical protein
MARVFDAHQTVLVTPSQTSTPLRTVTPTSGAALTGSLLLNSGFEQAVNNDGRLDRWATSSRFTRSRELYFSQSFSGKFYATASQTIQNLTAGAAYTFSGQVSWRNANHSVSRTSVVKPIQPPRMDGTGYREAQRPGGHNECAARHEYLQPEPRHLRGCLRLSDGSPIPTMVIYPKSRPKKLGWLSFHKNSSTFRILHKQSVSRPRRS